MSIRMILASVAALAMATPAVAAKSPVQPATSYETAGNGGAEARKICRNFKNTISRMKREKICLTRADWKKFEREMAQ